MREFQTTETTFGGVVLTLALCAVFLPAAALCLAETVADTFSDNFSDGNLTGWTVRSGAWWAHNQELSADGTDANHQIMIDRTFDQNVVVVEARARFVDSDYKIASILLRQGAGSSGWHEVRLDGRTDVAAVVIKGSVAASTSFNISPNTWYTMKAVVDMNHLLFYVNGQLKIERWDMPVHGEKIGLANTYGHVHFDDVAITAYLPKEDHTAACYSFNEGAGSYVADLSLIGNNGTIYGASWVTSGVSGGALSFDGSSSYVEAVDSASLNPSAAIAVEAWIRPDVIDINQRILSKDGSDPNGDYFLQVTSSGQLKFGVWTSAGLGIASGGSIRARVWQHVAGVYDGATVKAYINGSLVSSASLTGALYNGTANLKIGMCDRGLNEYFDGLIDEVKIFNEARTYTSAAFDRFPVAGFCFNEGSGVFAGDISLNGNNGIAYGAGWTVSGLSGGSLEFDGANDYVRAPDSLSLNPGAAMTVEAWIRPDVVNRFQRIVSKDGYDGQGAQQREYFLQVTSSGQLTFGVWTGGGFNYASGGSISAGVWQHVAGVYDGSMLRAYVNGSLVGSASLAGAPFDGRADLTIGRSDRGPSEYFDGLIDEVRIFGHAKDYGQMTSAAIQSLIDAVPSPGGGAVELDTGTYFISSPVRLPANVTLRGKGMERTTLALANGVHSAALMSRWSVYHTAPDPSKFNHGIAIEDITIYANKSGNSYSEAIYLCADFNKRVQSVRVEDSDGWAAMVAPGFGWAHTNSIPESNRILGCIVRDTISGNHGQDTWGGSGIFVTAPGSYDFHITGNLLESNATHGIFLEDYVADTTVSFNTCKGSGAAGIGYADSSYTVVEWNTVINNHRGIGISGNSHHNVVRYNTVRANRAEGIAFFDPGGSDRVYDSWSEIRNNIVQNNDQIQANCSGIVVAWRNNIIDSNTSNDTQTTKTQDYGIQTMWKADYNTITNNELRYNEKDGMRLVGANNVVAEPSSPVLAGSIALEDFRGDLALCPVRIRLMPDGSGSAQTHQITLASNPGPFSVGVEPGTYAVAFSCARCLTRTVAGVVVWPNSTKTLDPVSLPGGDANGDNEVTTTDLGITIKNMN